MITFALTSSPLLISKVVIRFGLISAVGRNYSLPLIVYSKPFIWELLRGGFYTLGVDWRAELKKILNVFEGTEL